MISSADDCSRKRCERKKKVFQGKAFIPDDHIQLISKYFQGANLNLNFTLDDDEISEKNSCTKNRKSRSKSKKRGRKHRKKRSNRCKCCKCQGEHQAPKNCCWEPKEKANTLRKPTCSDRIEPALTKCCCGCKPAKAVNCELRNCGEGKEKPAPPTCCCKNPVEYVPETTCCCCGGPCVGKNNNETNVNTEQREKKGKSESKTSKKCYRHAGCCCNERDDGKGRRSDENVKFDAKTRKQIKDQNKKGHEKAILPSKSPLSSESIKSTLSVTSDMNVTQVYVTKKASNLENDENYGRYWYHRQPLENTITHCDDEDDPGPSGIRDDSELGGPYDGRLAPNSERFTTANNALQDSGTDRFRNSTGRCMACKEPMCLLCKTKMCECDCVKPNFVICNPCKHRLTPKPPKKTCPPKEALPTNHPQQDCSDEAMFLLQLFASMRENINVQRCNC